MSVENEDEFIYSNIEHKIIREYRNLNLRGQEKIVGFLDDMNQLDKYKCNVVSLEWVKKKRKE